jgi:hypothetical protein
MLKKLEIGHYITLGLALIAAASVFGSVRYQVVAVNNKIDDNLILINGKFQHVEKEMRNLELDTKGMYHELKLDIKEIVQSANKRTREDIRELRKLYIEGKE